MIDVVADGTDTILFVDWCARVRARLERADELRAIADHLEQVIRALNNERSHLEQDAPPMPALTDREAKALNESVASYAETLNRDPSEDDWDRAARQRSIALDTRVVLGVQLGQIGAIQFDEARLKLRGPRR